MSDTTLALADGMVGIIHYTLRDDDGEVIDSSLEGEGAGEPLPYLHGAGNIVAGLERALEGKTVGDKLTVTVEPADGYGEPSGEEPQAVPAAQVEGPVEPGMQLVMQTPQGHHVPVWVVRSDDENIYLTGDHPLAGKNLNFEVEVVGVREATADERQHGHTHGIDGTEAHHHHHDHGGGGKRSLARREGEKRRRRQKKGKRKR